MSDEFCFIHNEIKVPKDKCFICSLENQIQQLKQQLEEKEKLIVALDKTRLRFTETISDLTEQKYEIKQQLEAVEKQLEISANQLEGVSLAIKQHGQNINVHFFIKYYEECANNKRQFLAKYRGEK